MIYSLIIITIAMLVTSQQIIIGDPCKCNQLLTEQECSNRGFCLWNQSQMICEAIDQQEIPMGLVSPPQQVKQNSFSMFCDNFSQIDCPFQNGCSWLEDRCVAFTGCTTYIQYKDEDCKMISNKCISDGVRCIELGECESYIYSSSCQVSNSGQYCVWNTENRTCQQAQKCSDLPKSVQSDKECRQQFNLCTAKEGGGCEESAFQCSDQKFKNACVTDIYQSVNCVWIENQCRDLICENAPQYYKTDEECKQFLFYCTTKQGGGCIPRSTCNDAEVEQACVTDNLGNDCFWDGNYCNERLCEYAPSTYITNEQCQSIADRCISSGAGCMNNYYCESALKEEYCKQDSVGNQCIWTGNNCKQKKCDKADQTYINDEQCSQYLSTCIGKINGEPGCQEKTCETAPQIFMTNQECLQYQSNCVIKLNGGCKQNTICLNIDNQQGCIKDQNGNNCYWNNNDSKCYQITLCQLIKNKDYCIKDIDNKECQWLEPLFNNQNESCVDKQCNTAPLYYTTEEQCQQYLNNCIPIKSGGCKNKGNCQDSDFINSCTTDKDGNSCIWDQDKCRKQECSDLQGQTFFQCNQQLNNCTFGWNGQCESMLQCEQYHHVLQCVKGLNGQCLWIDNYQNIDNTLGACFQFEQCESLKWKTDVDCKMASSSCTTDGEQCVPITVCQSTNTNGGCIMGTDGECIQSVPALYSNKPKKCSKFINCGTAYYLTHEECQAANKFCTTNGDSGCRDLNLCQYYYNIHSCHINYVGIVKDENNHVLSTGKCVWNQIDQQCQNEYCTDLIYTTEQECESALYICTSDGQGCVEKQICSTYQTQIICESRSGSDGSCFWDIQNQKCRLKECSEIQNGTTQNICDEVKNCVSDGVQCKQHSKCEEYQNQISCNTSGLDGICVWQNNQCSLMTSCNSANNDQNACSKANDRCYWNQKQCVEHTCLTFFNQEKQCKYFRTWDNTKFNICKIISGTCQLIDIEKLTKENCYNYSLYLYSWNPISNRCLQCSRIIENTKNQTQIKQNQSHFTQKSYILIAVAILLSLAI